MSPASSASQGAGQTARISTTEDGSTHPLAERLKPEPFRTQNKVAVLGTLAGRMGTSEVSSRWWMRHLQDALSSHRDGTRDFLQRATTRRNGVPIVVVRVTSHQGAEESSAQGEGAQVVGMQQPCGTRDAESQKGVGCRLLPPGDKLDCWRAK